MEDRYVIIERASDGRSAAILPDRFDNEEYVDADGKTYKQQGYRIVSYEDGTPFKPAKDPLEPPPRARGLVVEPGEPVAKKDDDGK